MVGEIERRTVSERMLIDNAHLSPNEIAAKTGFTPAEVAQRLTDLLDSRDWLTQKQQERLVIIQLQELVRDAQDRLGDADDDHYAAIANVVIRAAKEIGNRFDVIRKTIEIDISEITAAQAHVFGGAYDFAMDYVKDRLQERYGDIDRAELTAWAREGVQLAKKKLEDSIGEE